VFDFYVSTALTLIVLRGRTWPLCTFSSLPPLKISLWTEKKRNHKSVELLFSISSPRLSPSLFSRDQQFCWNPYFECLIVILCLAIAGLYFHTAVAGDFITARAGPQRAFFSKNAAHIAVVDGYGDERPISGRSGTRLRFNRHLAPVSSRSERSHRYHRTDDLSLTILSLPQEIFSSSSLLLRPGNSTRNWNSHIRPII